MRYGWLRPGAVIERLWHTFAIGAVSCARCRARTADRVRNRFSAENSLGAVRARRWPSVPAAVDRQRVMDVEGRRQSRLRRCSHVEYRDTGPGAADRKTPRCHPARIPGSCRRQNAIADSIGQTACADISADAKRVCSSQTHWFAVAVVSCQPRRSHIS